MKIEKFVYKKPCPNCGKLIIISIDQNGEKVFIDPSIPVYRIAIGKHPLHKEWGDIRAIRKDNCGIAHEC